MSDDPLLNKGELGPYQIEKKLGQGAMGGVYMGMHRVLQVHHAIKVIHPKLLGDTTLVERFLREARNTAKLKHMNIVQVVGADQVDGIYYLAMEFVQGKTLEQLMRSPGLSIHDAVRYIHMIANALNYAHSRKVIHRDIKPANIMVNEEDVAKLMDFGLVRDTAQPEGGESGEQLTMAGYIMGTPQYMPLEQWQGEGVDHRSDIYALGATFYVALTGKLPFPGKDAREIFRKVLTTQAVDVKSHNPDIDAQLAGVVHKAIAPEKDDRFQTGEEFGLALEAWWDQHPYQGTSLFKAPVIDDSRTQGGRSTLGSAASRSGGPAPSTRTATPSTRAVLTKGATGQGSSPTSMDAVPASRAPIFALLGLVLIIAIGVGVWLVLQGDDPPTASTFKIDIAAEQATEAAPLPVKSAQFSIPGEGDATVNEQPYTFGAALTLTPGLNELTVAPVSGTGGRTLYVFLDMQAPVLTVPGLDGRAGSMIPVDGAGYKLMGRVSDLGCGLSGLTLISRVDGDELALKVNDKGEFEREFPLGETDVTVVLQAQDRAGNLSDALTFWVVPDRKALTFEQAWEPASGWAITETFEISGNLNKSRGVTLKCEGDEVAVGEDGAFKVALTRKPGRYTIKFAATDWLGREAAFDLPVVVDLAPPVLRLTGPTATEFKFAAVPADVEVTGDLDSTEVKLLVDGKPVTPGTRGSFKATVTVKEFGARAVEIIATDPAGRETKQTLNLQISELQYRLLPANSKGYREYERLRDGMIMIEIPAGKFTRGFEPPEGYKKLADAEPVAIELSAFLIAKYETSNAQFAKFLTASQLTADEVVQQRWLVKDSDGFFYGLQPLGKTWTASEGLEDIAVVGITWKGAQAYCQWADPESSLPSEAQWEYAARVGTGGAYPWGGLEELPTTARANCNEQRSGPVEVTKYEAGASPCGALNMAGNVEEWCLDWYTEGNYTRADQQAKDPALTAKQSGYDMRVVRGGSYLSPFAKIPKPHIENERGNLHTFARARRLPEAGASDLGFRAAAKAPK